MAIYVSLNKRKIKKKKIVMCMLYNVRETQRGVNSCYFVVFGLSRKTVIFSSAAFNTSFLNPCYRDWRIYMMQLLLRIPLLSEDRLFSNLSSKL